MMMRADATPRAVLRRWLWLALALALSHARATASVTLADAFALARDHRAELQASAARVDAARQRPAIVSALEDPVLAPSIDHKPVDPMMKTDRSITLEQSFPLSRIRSHRRHAAQADIEKFEGEAVKAGLGIQAEVAKAFFMLHERRRMHAILAPQVQQARELANVAAARYATGAAPQADLLRAELEEARLRSRLALSAADVSAAEAMFNAALGRAAAAPVPPLLVADTLQQMARLPSLDSARQAALERRPELRISGAELRRARAEIEVMKSMYAPMLMVRAGQAETMTAGRGYMLMVGISLPIWSGKLDAGVREARAMAGMAGADREAMLRMIDGDVTSSHRALEGAVALQQAFQAELVPRAERAIVPALAAYRSGSLPLASVLEAYRAWWSVQEELAMADTALAMAWIRHRNAIGDFGELP